MRTVYSVYSSSSTCYTREELEKFIMTFKEMVVTFHTFPFQVDMLKELVDTKKVKALFITHEDRTVEAYNG